MGTKVILVGAFQEIVELCQDCNIDIFGIIDNNLSIDFNGIPILGTDNNAKELYCNYKNYPLVITPDSPYIRKKIVERYSTIGFQFATIISPKATISKSAKIGRGTIIQAGVNISSDTTIGDFCKLNTNANVMHDNIIGDYITIAPNAVLLGRVRLDTFSYIGANSTILPNISISQHTIIGAGSVVTKNVPENSIVAGVPARKIKQDL